MFFKRRFRSRVCYASEAIYLDIETSNNHASDPRKLRTWITSIQVRFDNNYYLFRKPTELTAWLNSLIKKYDLDQDRRILVFIHNAAYDLSYLVPWFQRDLPAEPRRGIYEGLHKIIMYDQYCFEFRCTYQLTGMSLAKWSKDMNVEHKKQVGLYDYDKVIYQDEELDQDSLKYDEYDVLSLEECLKKQLIKYDDELGTIPLTSTGYCRRLFRKGSQRDRYYRSKIFLPSRLDLKAMKYSINAFAGGYTHGNRYLKSNIIDALKDYDCLIAHGDFRSMYPSEIMCYPHPFGAPEEWYDASRLYYMKRPYKPSIDDIINMYPEYSSITRLRIYAAELRSLDITMPFMQEAKLRNKTKNFQCLSDNGRVMKIVHGVCEIYVDNLTLKILKEQYKMKLVILGVIRFKNMMIPECLARTIDDLFKAKSDLKVHHREMEKKYGHFSAEAINAAWELSRVKKLLNACYGMFATSPLRAEYDLDYSKDPPLQRIKGITTDQEIEEALEKFYKSSNSFLPYQIGWSCTAAARYELYEYIKAVGYKNVLYCDTDSIFFLKKRGVMERVKRLNEEKQKTAKYVTSHGKRVYYDVFEFEDDLTHFKFLHSKCYGMITEKGEFQATIAGIPARSLIGRTVGKDGEPVYLTREEELAGITPQDKLLDPNIKISDPVAALDNLKDTTRFTTNTGTKAYYIIEEPHEEMIDGHLTEIAGGCVINKLDEKYIKDIDIANFELDYSMEDEEY